MIDPVSERTLSQALFEAYPVPAWVYDIETLAILAVNDAAVAAYGWSHAEFAALDLFDIRPADDHERFRALHASVARTEPLATRGWRHLTKSGRVRVVDVVSSVEVHYGGRRGRVAIMTDVTEKQHASDELERLAYRDAATGLPNRTWLARELDGTRLARGAAILLVQLDVVTASVHRTGAAWDRIAKTAARLLREALPQGSTLAHVGDLVFAVLAPVPEAQRFARPWADQVFTIFQRPLELSGDEAVANPTIGMAIVREAEVGGEALLARAFAALDDARRRGYALQEFSTELSERSDRAAAIDRHLRSAMPDQLSLVYQPIVSIAEGTVSGVEALLRWHSPVLGDVSPAEFIPIAEASGFIDRLGSWVLRRACSEYASWGLGATRPKLMVNVSSGQLRHGDIIRSLTSVIDDERIRLSDIAIEVTESTTIDPAGRGAGILRALRRLGVGVAIDDFGTGYSSLSYLGALPLDVVKIDRSFVQGMRENRSQAAIVAAVIGVAHEIGLRVVGEGVETREQLDALRALGCDAAQGFLFARPMPSAAIRGLLAAGGPLEVRTAS